MRFPILSATAFGIALSTAQAISPQETEFFEKQVRPVLAEHCYSCHGEKKQKAELRLDSRAAILKGSDVGAVVVVGKPEESSLIKSIRHEGDSKMPEKEGKLSDEKITALTEWVRMGLPWPDGDAAKLTAQQEAAAKHWSFQPIRQPAAPTASDEKHWGQSTVDQFVLAKLESAGIEPAPMADRRTLIRRATFDLTGLPPTAQEVEAFENDTAPDAFARVVDRLLASPRYGERWARYWLDIARYADTKGYVFQEERRYPYSYTYRDWVIQAMNEDLPYDQFIIQQLAADQVVSKEDQRPLAAMGFLTLGRRFLNNQNDIIDDRLDVVGRGLMGLTIACARCHDHKFDPIPQKDYYALHGVFASSVEPKELPSLPDSRDPQTKAEYDAEFSKLQAKVDEYLEQKRAEKMVALSGALHLPVVLTTDVADRFLDRQERDRLREHRNKIEALNAGPLAPPRAMVLNDAPQPVNPRVFIRGNPGRPGEQVPRRFLTVLSGGDPKPFQNGSGRLELAKAIASKDNPLTARVIVNRVWMYHFGKGLVRTPGDFGVKGEAPTHPELLNWLASRFIEEGWSIKKLHRTIMLSSVYQQSSDVSEKAAHADPENRLLSRMNRRRLDFEAMRDSLLSVTGQLDLQMGGRAVELTNSPFARRRAVYGFIDRQNLPGTFRTFDFASPDTTSPQRYSTTVPQQALFMLNSPFVIEQARALAAKPELKGDQSPSEWQIQALYEQVFARHAESTEVDAALHFITQQLTQPQQDDERPIWQYGYGAYDEATKRVKFERFAHFKNQMWQAGPTLPDPKFGHVLLRADGGHTGQDAQHSAIRRWTAPQDMVVSIAGVLARPSEHGDGVIGRIISSRSGEIAKYDVGPSGSAETRIERVEVNRGDTLDFLVECKENDNSDTFNWAPLIQNTAGGEWDAKIAFAGPPPARPAPLKAWEKYAQVLLATNEFVFVD